jgi:hypothetical protein
MSATLSANAPASPVVRLRGTVAVDGNLLLWSVLERDLEVIVETMKELATFLLFDVDCNQFIGPSKKPISSSTAQLYGGDGPFVPGGILRVGMVVSPRDAPVTFMRRPFARAAIAPVMPGVTLQPVIG